jgi:hypothetical protein
MEWGKGSLSLVAGDSPGVDEAVREYATATDSDLYVLKPYHMLDKSTQFSNKFYFIRNKQIMDNADHMLFIRDILEEDEVVKAIHYCQRVKKSYVIMENV